MQAGTAVRSLSRFATRQVVLAVLVVVFAMGALALLAEALNSGGGTVYLAEIQSSSRAPGSAPSLVAIGYGSATAPADTGSMQFLLSNSDGFGGGGPYMQPTPGATHGAAEREAAAPLVEAIVAAGIPREAIRVVTSAAYGMSDYGMPMGMTFRIDVEIGAPDLESVNSIVDTVAQIAEEHGVHLVTVGAGYRVNDCAALRAQAWETAVTDARARASSQAALLEVELGDLLLSQETPIDRDRLDGASITASVCSDGQTSSGRFGYQSASPSLPLFDPTGAPTVFADVQVSLAFEIIRD